jgi:hypothetical protein
MLGTRPDAPLWQSFINDLRDHGWQEGHNVRIEGRWAQLAPGGYVELASELVSLKMDVIVANAPRAVQALRHTDHNGCR